MGSHEGVDSIDASSEKKPWTFLTNHTRALMVISEDPKVRLRDIAATIGVTERATQRIIADLEEAGYLSHERIGRRNVYRIESEQNLRRGLEQNSQLRSLLEALCPYTTKRVV